MQEPIETIEERATGGRRNSSPQVPDAGPQETRLPLPFSVNASSPARKRTPMEEPTVLFCVFQVATAEIARNFAQNSTGNPE